MSAIDTNHIKTFIDIGDFPYIIRGLTQLQLTNYICIVCKILDKSKVFLRYDIMLTCN